MPISIANGAGSNAIEAHTSPVGGGGENLRTVAAVDLHGIGSPAAFIEIGVVAGIPDHAIVARFAEHLVVCVTARQSVVVPRRRRESRSRPRPRSVSFPVCPKS